MGKIQILNKEQILILEGISNNQYFRDNFYFTGGTVLSELYLHHRYSEDLDFFSEERFNNQIILSLMTELSNKCGFSFRSQFQEVVYRFDLNFSNNANCKVDFGFYPYKRIEKGKYFNNLQTDSLLDIAANKLFTLNQRTDIKDFVDIFFLLKEKFTIWDLIYGVEKKFHQEIEKIVLAQDFLKIEDFQTLPHMIAPLTLQKLKLFFREKAKELGLSAVV